MKNEGRKRKYKQNIRINYYMDLKGSSSFINWLARQLWSAKVQTAMPCTSHPARGLSPPPIPSTGSVWAHIQIILTKDSELNTRASFKAPHHRTITLSTQIRHSTSTLPRKHLEVRTSNCKMISHLLLLQMRQDTITQCGSDFLQRCNYQRFLTWTLKLTLKGAGLYSVWNPPHSAGNAHDKNQK